MFSHVSGKPLKNLTFVTIVPYLWMIGVAMLAHGLMAGGLMGEPRRTNLGLTYTNPESPLFNSNWVPSTTMTMLGGLIMGTAALLFFFCFFRMMFSKSVNEPVISLIESEELHVEKPIPLLLNMRPWIILAIALIASTYYPSLKNVFKYGKPVENRFDMENPVNLNKDAK